MGGHAFRRLNVPRISSEVYTQVKLQATVALQTIFSHVVVPMEYPGKKDYGDVDFLVSAPFHSPSSTSVKTFDWPGTVRRIKSVFNTSYGGRSPLENSDIMFFAIRPNGYEDEDFWVQVDVKVCFKSELFEWQTYEYSHGTISKMMGSMVKPLGLTIRPEGLYIRIEEMDEVNETNISGNLIWISKDPRDVLRIMGLDRRVLDSSLKTTEERKYCRRTARFTRLTYSLVHEYLAGSWLFNPSHFAARLATENYARRIDDRSPHWIPFIKEWIPSRYPCYGYATDAWDSIEDTIDPAQRDVDLKTWNKNKRAAVREKVLTMYPNIAQAYYTKRAAHVKGLEEQRLKALIIKALPKGDAGWKDDLLQPCIIVKRSEADLKTPKFGITASGQLTPPVMPEDKVFDPDVIVTNLIIPSSSSPVQPASVWDVPLHLEALPRKPPYAWKPSPPPANMGDDRKLLCIARWTQFDPPTVNFPFFLHPMARDPRCTGLIQPTLEPRIKSLSTG